DWGYEANIGYMPQDHGESIAKSRQSAYDWVREVDTKTDEQDVRSLFGRMLFSKDEPLKPTEVLSGGETVRLLLVRLMLQKPNVLLLDEPTNHLDLESIRALTHGLAQFEGTVIFVTHDRHMVARVASRVLEMSSSGIRELSPDQFERGDYLGQYGRYRGAQAAPLWVDRRLKSGRKSGPTSGEETGRQGPGTRGTEGARSASVRFQGPLGPRSDKLRDCAGVMFEQFFSAPNLPFAVALLVMLGIGLLEGIGMLLGGGLSGLVDGALPDLDADLDVD